MNELNWIETANGNPGDTLSEIAERYNVSMSDIRVANKLANDRVRVGQTLRIPIRAGI